MNHTYQLFPIGQIHVSEDGFWLELESEFAPALSGLDGFSLVNVYWWADQLDQPELRQMKTCQSPYKDAPEELGIFATRSPIRPNPVCHTVCAVLRIDHEKPNIYVAYIDAEDGTPILDIKPYHPSVDRAREVSVPGWCASWPQWLEESATFDWESVFDNAR